MEAKNFKLTNTETQALVFRILFMEELFDPKSESYAATPRREFKRDLARDVMRWKVLFDNATVHVFVNKDASEVKVLNKTEMKEQAEQLSKDGFEANGEQRLSNDVEMEVSEGMAKAFNHYYKDRDNLPLPESNEAFEAFEEFVQFCEGVK